MKKYFVAVIFLIILFVSVGNGFMSLLEAAEIVYVEGKVQVQSAAEKAWKKANKGTKLNIGDSIRTARRSKTDLLLDQEKKNSIRIEENTLLVFNSSSPGEFNKFDLSRGKIYANIEKIKAGIAYEVCTPSSIAGVRGTGWSVASEDRSDQVAVFKDEVYVKAFDAQKNLISETTIPEGFTAEIERFQGPSALTKISEGEMARWNETRQEVSQHIEQRTIEEQKEPAKETTETEATTQETIEYITNIEEATAEEITKAKEETQEQQTGEEIEETRVEEGGHCG